VIVSFTLSVPTAISYESVEVLNTEMNIIGFSCKKIQNEEDTGFLEKKTSVFFVLDFLATKTYYVHFSIKHFYGFIRYGCWDR
jgi:hypothetical protein